MSGLTTTRELLYWDWILKPMPKRTVIWRSMTQMDRRIRKIIGTNRGIFPLLDRWNWSLFVSRNLPGPYFWKFILGYLRQLNRTLVCLLWAWLLAGHVIVWQVNDPFWCINHALNRLWRQCFSTKISAWPTTIGLLSKYTSQSFHVPCGTNFTVITLGLVGKFKRVLKVMNQTYTFSLNSKSQASCTSQIFAARWCFQWIGIPELAISGGFSLVTTTGLFPDD